MRISCDVQICNRILPSFNVKKSTKPCHAQLSVGKKPVCSGSSSQEIFLMICTKQDLNGAKYRLASNIEQCFKKFTQQGKATVRFTAPQHDLFLSKADPIQLRCFLTLLQCVCQQGNLDGIRLSCLAPASNKQVEKAPSKLVVLSRKEYPMTTSFPAALENLCINNCMLKRVDLRILKLRHLRMLDLSNNHLAELPHDMSALTNLTELNLTANKLAQFPQELCRPALADRLQLLDLSSNNFDHFPACVCRLRALVTLRFDRNLLTRLPACFSQLRRLKFFSAAHNQLRVLPATFARVCLESLDLYGNAFVDDGSSSGENRLEFPMLMELAARAIYKHRVPYTHDDVGHLCFAYLACNKTCLCGCVCFQSHIYYHTRVDLRRIAASVIAIDSAGRMHAPCEAYLCSVRCQQKYLNSSRTGFS